MSRRKFSLRRRDGLLVLVCIIASAFIFLNNTHQFNNLLSFLPIIYGFCYAFFLAPTRLRTGSKTVFWFSVVEFIRLVFVPCYESVSGYIGFFGFMTENMSLLGRSVLLMASPPLRVRNLLPDHHSDRCKDRRSCGCTPRSDSSFPSRRPPSQVTYGRSTTLWITSQTAP